MKFKFYLLKKISIEKLMIDDLLKNDFISSKNLIYEEILRRVDEKIYKLFLDESYEY